MTITRGKSLRARYTFWTFLSTGLLSSFFLLSFAFLSYQMFLNDYEREMESRMEIAAASLASMIARTDSLGMTQQANSLLVTEGVCGVTICDVNNHPLIQKGQTTGFLLQRPILHNSEQIGTIQVTFSNAPIKNKIRTLVILGGFISCIGVPLTAVLMWFVSGQQLQDIHTLAKEVQKIGDLESDNINLSGTERNDEIGLLARALTVRNDAIRESKKQEQLLYHAIDQSHDSVVITDFKGNIEYVNPAFSRITGYSSEESLGLNPRMLQSGKHPKKFYDAMWKNLTQGKSWQGLIINKRKNGEEYQEEATISPVIDHTGTIHHFVAMKRDVTQEVILERKLARAEKMQAIGLLAGGVAHDLNNILAGVVGYPELLLLGLPKDSNIRKPLEAILESGQKAATVVADLLTVARGVAATKTAHNLHTLVCEYLDSLECHNLKSLYPQITFKLQLDAKQKAINCSSVHIQKCLMNLATNAAESIKGKGIVRISSSNKTILNQEKSAESLKDGEYVVLSVQDTGTGISPKDLDHIFEPFYTRKIMGRSGTGLGLAVVWNTVHDHNGKIHVESSGEGTVFRLYFPVLGEHQILQDTGHVSRDITGNGEHILVIDDEPQLRDIAGSMLQTLGYKVDSVSSGELAIEFVRKSPVDLLVIDMLMEPGINGQKTYEEIIKIRPDQKAIITSGFSLSKDVKLTLKQGAEKFINKPYTLEQLGEAVKEILHA
jgi:PAS domain S-box-containing protein